MFGTRTLAIISGSILAALVVAIGAGNAAIGAGIVSHPESFETPAKIVFFTLFVAFGFSLIPLMVRLVLSFQAAIGNARYAPIKAAIDREGWIVAFLWILMATGLAAGLPAAVRQGFFGDANAIASMPTQGTLVAAPGMLLSRMLAGSTLSIRPGTSSPLFSGARFGGAAIFDFRVAGTGMVFRRCRYYYITTYTSNPNRIESIDVGISAEKMTRAELDADERNLRSAFETDGWRPARSPDNWVKGGTLLALRSRRLDDPVTGEDPARAGEWIDYVELSER